MSTPDYTTYTCGECGHVNLRNTIRKDDFSLHSAAVDKIVRISATLAGAAELLSQIVNSGPVSSFDVTIVNMLREINNVLGRDEKDV
jgi:hypothetical protein